MSREIQFRAWDKVDKKFIYFMLCNNHYELTGIEHNESLSKHDLEDWQQFTGLKDKNGVEIYEGDIVKVNIPLNSGVFEMKWNNNGFWLDHKDGIYTAPNKEYLKVIGNKWENPELLTNQ